MILKENDEVRDLGSLVDTKYSFAHLGEQTTRNARQLIFYVK